MNSKQIFTAQVHGETYTVNIQLDRAEEDGEQIGYADFFGLVPNSDEDLHGLVSDWLFQTSA